jgi:hypothetical protein
MQDAAAPQKHKVESYYKTYNKKHVYDDSAKVCIEKVKF